MVKIFKAVHAIVAGNTIRAKSKHMSLGEGTVDVAVAGLARVWCEGCDVRGMAVFASYRRAQSDPFMFIQ